MKLKSCSLMHIKAISKNKKIICFGAGGVFMNLFLSAPDLEIEKRIDYIADNDSGKWGTFINVNGTQVEICSPARLSSYDRSAHVIVITAMRINEIYSQIQNITSNSKGVCYRYPTYRNRFTMLFNRITKALPLKNYIVLNGEGDTCENAVALGKYMRENGYLKKYKLGWLCDNPDKFIDFGNEKYISRKIGLKNMSPSELWKYYSFMNRSRYIIFENQLMNKKRFDQISVYLNHGSPPIKATKGKINLPTDLNYAVCPSENCMDILSEQYGINKERLLCCGSPRTDCFFDGQIHSALTALTERDRFKKIILWVPTFRQHARNRRVDTKFTHEYGIPVIRTEEHWKILAEKLASLNILLIIKPHLLQKLDVLKIAETDNIRFITQDDLERADATVYDLMKLTDAMITDYSTIAFDFMLLDRMIGYTLDDINEYSLGFSVSDPLKLMPGNKIYEFEELIGYICDVYASNDTFKAERDEVNSFIHGGFKDGRNSERLCSLLKL